MHENNFDFLRIVFAIFVIISHSFVLSGSVSLDWLAQISNNQTSFSNIGVAGFFALSGYLVMQSLSRSTTLTEYFLKRFLRIYPALIVLLIVTVVLAPFVYNGSLLNYLGNMSTWTYVPFNLSLFKMQYAINGVFENNPFKSVINGSLCTLPYEMLFYVLLASLYFFKNKATRISILSIVFCSAMLVKIFLHPYFISHGYPFFMRRIVDYSGGFIVGALLALFKIEKINYKGFLIIGSIVVWIISIQFNFYFWTQYFVLPLTVILIGTSSIPILRNAKSKIGDLSYGVYIYAFPVQQTLMHFFKLSYLPLMLWGTIVTLPFAFLSWHLVEKKALGLKYKLTRITPV